MPINAAIKDKIISSRHLTTSPKFSGTTLAAVSNVAIETGTATVNMEYVTAVVITTSNITLSGTQTIDSIAIVAGMTVLVNAQTNKANNGLYACYSGAWLRLTGITLINGFIVVIARGTYADTVWVESLEFDFFVLGTTLLEWVQVGAGGADYITSILDTDAIDLTVTAGVLSADLLTQNSNSIIHDVLPGGLISQVVIANPTVGGTLSISVDGLEFNHNFSEGDAIELIANSPSTNMLKIQVENLGITTAKLADDAVTNTKIADGAVTTAKLADLAVTNVKLGLNAADYDKIRADSVGLKHLLIENSDGYLNFYTGSAFPGPGNGPGLGINLVASKFTHNYKNETLTSGGVQNVTTHTLRFPPVGTDYYPIGIYHIDAYAVITALNMFNQTMNNTVAPTMTIKVSGIGGGTQIDNGLSHEDLASGVQKMINNSLQGSKIIDLTSTTLADRYFEIIITCNVNAAITKSGVVGYVDIFELKPAGVIAYDT